MAIHTREAVAEWQRRERADQRAGRRLPKEATHHLPGSIGKIRVLAERRRRGESLWHPLDHRLSIVHLHVLLMEQEAAAAEEEQANPLAAAMRGALLQTEEGQDRKLKAMPKAKRPMRSGITSRRAE
jgi:hypothetical protein